MTRIAAIQTNSSDNVQENLDRIKPLLDEAAGQDADIAVLPECFAFMQSSRRQLLETAEADGAGPIQQFCMDQASRLGMWIVAGSLPLVSGQLGKVSNTMCVYGPDGSRVARYHKIFLFDISLDSGESYNESDYTVAGDQTCNVVAADINLGLSVCYDLRFPELYRRLAQQGAQVLLVPSAFSSTTGRDHWMALLRARAIENLCYVVAPAQFGEHNARRKTWGHTALIDPWGEVIGELEQGWANLYVDIDTQKLASMRKQLPCLLHRRPDIFEQ